MTDNTLLVLSGIGIPAYSARGLSQSLELIEQAAFMRRDINGALVNLSDSRFQRYKSTITGTDHKAPAVDGVWPGHQVIVDCVQEFAYPIGGVPSRFVVPGSEHEDGGFMYYRPRLLMQVLSFNLNTDEWNAQVGWSMVLEET